jgi:hypothetical protein
MTTTTGLLTCVLFLALGGCGSSANEASGGNVQIVAPAAQPLNASGVAAALKSGGLPVQNIVAVTEASDDNKMLGRPGQYTSKVFFYDRRHPKNNGNDAGENTVEVFANAEDAARRRDYVAEVTKSMPLLTQYSYLNGTILVRLSKDLLPSEAKQYEEAVDSLRF